MKILYILNVANRVNNFAMSSVNAAIQGKYEFHIAGNWSYTDEMRKEDEKRLGIHIHQVDFVRSPYSLKNRTAFKQLVDIIKTENIDYIHCNTPVGGLLGRLAGRKLRIKKVIYQAHGFHFYKGAPLINWLIYYPIERLMAHYTDAMITINKEDYERAKTFKLRKGGSVYYVPGVGIEYSEFDMPNFDRQNKRKELGLADDDIMLLSIGEINANKNQEVILKAMKLIDNKKIHYFIAGKGELEEKLKAFADSNGLKSNFHLLGYRSDVAELYKAADVFCFSSKREGLSRAIMEAMASGLPCVASDIRGNVDLIDKNKGGYLSPPDDAEAFAKAIYELVKNERLRHSMGQYNTEKVKEFGMDSVTEIMSEIYTKTYKLGDKYGKVGK